jgi:hypothetical protein
MKEGRQRRGLAMSVYNWVLVFPICGGLTVLGLVLSWLTARRRGLAAGLRGAAWSLLPLAAYLTGAVKMIWRIGSAIGSFAASFVFSPLVWSGIAVTGLAVVLFVVSGSVRGRRARKVKAEPAGPALSTSQPGGRALDAGKSSKPAKGKPAGAMDDDLGDVADILRKHGIK